MSRKRRKGAPCENVAVKVRIYPDEAQASLIARTIGCARLVWNLMVADLRAFGEFCTPATYKEERPFLAEVDSLALCNAQMALAQAIANHKENPEHFGFPTFHSKKRSKKSYTTSAVYSKSGACNVRVEGAYIRLPKLGPVRMRGYRKPKGAWRVKSVTVTRKGAGRHFASILYERQAEGPVAPVPLSEARLLALDYSTPSLYVTDAGEKPNYPHPYYAYQKKLAREQRRLSKMEEGSSNWKKQLGRVCRIHMRIADVRRDWIEKESSRIARECDYVFVETLPNLSRKTLKGHAKKNHDNAWGAFCAALSRKLSAKGGALVKVDQWFPSSKTCSGCGHKNEELALEDREWVCPECGGYLDRDVNAARNILGEGLRVLVAQREGQKAA